MKLAHSICAFGIVASLFVTRLGQADPGDFWCDAGWSWAGYTKIPVWIHPDYADHYMIHQDGTFWTDDELQREVEFNIERVMAQAPSGMPPLYFAGFEYAGTGWDDPAGNGPGGIPGPGNIAIRPNLGNGNPCGSFSPGSATDPKGVRLDLAIGTEACLIRFEHWFYATYDSQERTFSGEMLHELYHGLGFNHADVCNPPGSLVCTDNPMEPQCCGLMDTHGLRSEWSELEYADLDGLVSKYGLWENDGRYRAESSDALTWTTLTPGTLPSGPFAASAWSSAAQTSIITTDTGFYNFPHVWRWDHSGSLTDWGYPLFASQIGQIATAYMSTDFFAFIGRPLSMTSAYKQPQYAYSPTSSVLWTSVSSSYYMGRPGNNGTYDPKSGKLIHIWRDYDDTILMSTSTLTGLPTAPVTPSSVTGANNKASYTPAISCGDASITYNCVMVWATAAAAGTGQHYHQMKWSSFYFNGSAFVFSNTIQNGYIMFGPPSIVYKGPSTSTSAWVVGWHTPGNCYYTLHKSTDPAVGFVDERSHCSAAGTHNGPPMLGATNSNYVEAWSFFNTED